MELTEAIKQRHSVRAFEDREITGTTKKILLQLIKSCNKESGLHIQLVLNEPQAFDNFISHYGNFSGVRNYIAVVGKKSAGMEELCGYYGEKIVLHAQQLGLNTCWVAITYNKIKNAFEIREGEKLYLVIAIGYGVNQGIPHDSKTVENVSKVHGPMPDWFRKGVEAALLAPTSMNQQKFKFILNDNKVATKPGLGFYSKMDLGIAKYHFEIGAGTGNFRWS